MDNFLDPVAKNACIVLRSTLLNLELLSWTFLGLNVSHYMMMFSYVECFCIHVTALYVLTFLPWILISTLLATVSITPIWTPSKAKKVSMMGNRVHTGIMVKHRATEMTHSSNIIVQSYLKGEAVDVLKQSCLVKALLAIFLMLAHVKFWMSSSSSHRFLHRVLCSCCSRDAMVRNSWPSSDLERQGVAKRYYVTRTTRSTDAKLISSVDHQMVVHLRKVNK